MTVKTNRLPKSMIDAEVAQTFYKRQLHGLSKRMVSGGLERDELGKLRKEQDKLKRMVANCKRQVHDYTSTNSCFMRRAKKELSKDQWDAILDLSKSDSRDLNNEIKRRAKIRNEHNTNPKWIPQ